MSSDLFHPSFNSSSIIPYHPYIQYGWSLFKNACQPRQKKKKALGSTDLFYREQFFSYRARFLNERKECKAILRRVHMTWVMIPFDYHQEIPGKNLDCGNV
jgi:hypothetical protein